MNQLSDHEMDLHATIWTAIGAYALFVLFQEAATGYFSGSEGA